MKVNYYPKNECYDPHFNQKLKFWMEGGLKILRDCRKSNSKVAAKSVYITLHYISHKICFTLTYKIK